MRTLRNQTSVLFHFSFFFLILNALNLFIYFFTLQYCIGFAIHQHASATGVHVFTLVFKQHYLSFETDDTFLIKQMMHF